MEQFAHDGLQREQTVLVDQVNCSPGFCQELTPSATRRDAYQDSNLLLWK